MEEEYSEQQSENYKERFDKYIAELKQFTNSYSPHPPGNGISKKELNNASENQKKGLINSYELSGLLLDVTYDHISSFLRTINSPSLTISPWSTARSAIESSSLSSWFSDTKINILERITRGYTYRIDGVNEQIKIFNSMGDKQNIKDTEEIKAKLIHEADEIGIKAVKDKKEKIIGIGKELPPITKIIQEQLNYEPIYRILSSITHGYSWSITQVSYFKVVDGEHPIIKRKLHPNAICLLCHLLTDAIIVPINNLVALFGWDISKTKIIYLSARNDFKHITNSMV